MLYVLSLGVGLTAAVAADYMAMLDGCPGWTYRSVGILIFAVSAYGIAKACEINVLRRSVGSPCDDCDSPFDEHCDTCEKFTSRS